MKVSNISYISYLLNEKNNQLRYKSMTEFTRSKRKLISMESRYSIGAMLNFDNFTKSYNHEQNL